MKRATQYLGIAALATALTACGGARESPYSSPSELISNRSFPVVGQPESARIYDSKFGKCLEIKHYSTPKVLSTALRCGVGDAFYAQVVHAAQLVNQEANDGDQENIEFDLMVHDGPKEKPMEMRSLKVQDTTFRF